MTNYPEDRGSYPEGGQNPSAPEYQEGGGHNYQGPGGYQGGSSEYQGGSSAYQGGGQYGAGGPDTTQYSGGDQQHWGGQQGHQYQGHQGQGHQGQGGFQGMMQGGPLGNRGGRPNIRSTFKTTEFWIFVVVSIGLLIAAAVTDEGVDNQGFSAHEAWKFVVWLAIGYMLSRGLTKFGGHERGERGDRHHDHR
jgi:hypothetical protein